MSDDLIDYKHTLPTYSDALMVNMTEHLVMKNLKHDSDIGLITNYTYLPPYLFQSLT